MAYCAPILIMPGKISLCQSIWSCSDFLFVFYSCHGAFDRLIHLPLLFGGRQRWLHLGPDGHLLPGGSIPPPVNIHFGSAFRFFENIAACTFVGTRSRALPIIEDVWTIRLDIELGCGAMQRSPTVLIVTDTEGSVFGGITTNFATLIRGVYTLFSFRSSISGPGSKLFCDVASRAGGDAYFKIFAAERDRMGTICRSIGSISSTNLSMNDVLIDSSTLYIVDTKVDTYA